MDYRSSSTSASFVAVIGLLLLAPYGTASAQRVDADLAETIEVRRAFHVAGVAGLKRNATGDLTLTTRALKFRRGDREALVIPYNRMSTVRITAATRDRAKATYAAVLAAGAPGALLLMKKRSVEALAIDYENERGGRVSAVFHLPKGDGRRCREWLSRFGIRFQEPDRSQWLKEPNASGN